MKSQNNLLADLLDFDTPEASQDVLWSAGYRILSMHRMDMSELNWIFLLRPLMKEGIEPDETIPPKRHTLWVSAYGEDIIRLTINFNGNELPADKNNVMLDIDETLKQLPLSMEKDSRLENYRSHGEDAHEDQ